MSLNCDLVQSDAYQKALIEVSNNNKKYLFSYPCGEEDNCIPYQCSFTRGKYLFELWGAGDKHHKNGGYVSGSLFLDEKTTLFLYVGPNEKFFNAVDLGESNGHRGNGASDVRINYSEKWYDFESLKSRIIVAGAGGKNVQNKIGDRYGVSLLVGSYGFAGGLNGSIGLFGENLSYSDRMIHSGEPGEQEKPGNGGLAGQCDIGGSGHFGIGGLPGVGCGTDKQDGFAGSGGYYGSGGSGGYDYSYWAPKGTAGGSSVISGHKGCSAITIDSKIHNITHTHSSWHYSGLFFKDTIMIDGSGHEWTSTHAGGLKNMPNPNGGYYQLNEGHPGNGYIRITILNNGICNQIICPEHNNFLPLLFITMTS